MGSEDNNIKKISDAQVTINSAGLDSGQVRVDVAMEDVPANLFGASFHLKLEGVDVVLENYSLGDVFSGADPLILVKEKDGDTHEIVVGISLKRDETYYVADGNLISFYLQSAENGELAVSFEDAVLSVFDNGRMDLEGVEWVGREVLIEGVEVFEVEDAKIESEEESGSVLGASTLLRSDNGGMSMNNRDIAIGELYVFLFSAFLILVFGYMVYLWLSREKS